MGTLAILLLPVVAVWAIYLTIRGFEAPPAETDFIPLLAVEKSFAQDTSRVQAAYRAATRDTPGMSIAEEKDGVFLIDSRPTMRLMSGDFGSVLRITVTSANPGSRLLMEYAPKTTSVLVRNHNSAFTEKERALRMKAKQLGPLTESA